MMKFQLLLLVLEILIIKSQCLIFEDLVKNKENEEQRLECVRNSAVYKENGYFTMPCGVDRVRVLVVGGGAGGSGGSGVGGSSGLVAIGEFALRPLAMVEVKVGRGGMGSPESNGAPGGRGERSSFGNLLSAEGGNSTYGGSGGGQGCQVDGWSGDGGSSGSNGFPASGCDGNKYSHIGIGQYFYPQLSNFKLNSISAGKGGFGSSTKWRGPGGGGGGGILFNRRGPTAENGESAAGGAGGNGYGAGGGAGGFTTWPTDKYYAGGKGADGFVYVEWE